MRSPTIAATLFRSIATVRRTGKLICACAQSLWPLLAPFVVAMGFIVFYCGGNLCRGWACLVGEPAGDGQRAENAVGGRCRGMPGFETHELGEQVSP